MRRNWLPMLLGATMLAGCAGTFNQSLDAVDRSKQQAPAAIMLSDAKLYRREALINERNREIAYLDDLLDKSRTIEIKPELLREVEQVAAMSASLGVSFDPAAALNYRRARDVGNLEQEQRLSRLEAAADPELVALRREIDIQKLTFELEKLKGQVAAVQKDPAASGGGAAAATSGSVTAATSSNEAPDPSAVMARIDGLVSDLQERLGEDAARPSNASLNPIDQFRDRDSYRAMLKAARNAAALDDLHDDRGAALIRLNFQATVLPDSQRPRAAGMVRASITGPRWDAAKTTFTYKLWLNYLNDRLNNVTTAAGVVTDISANADLVALADLGLFELGYLRVPKPSQVDPSCKGVTGQPDNAKCLFIAFAVPPAARQRPDDPAGFVERFEILQSALTMQSRAATIGAMGNATRQLQGGAQADQTAISDALEITALSRSLTVAGPRLRTLLRRHGIDGDASGFDSLAVDAAHGLVAQLAARGLAPAGMTPDSPLVAPAAFATTVTAASRIAVYDVGPREQAQQVSTVARSAQALSLAAAVAAQAPSSGVGARAGLGFLRQAIGKAEALERVPTVVGFASAANSFAPTAPDANTAFGWLVLPRATVKPGKGTITLAQNFRAQDLSVDLAVPGWWLELHLAVSTAWAPDWQTMPETGLRPDARTARTQLVPLPTRPGDMAALTELLAGEIGHVSSIDDVSPRAIAACEDIVLRIKGKDIWRASSVLLNGRRFTGTDIEVMPDMLGILVSVKGGSKAREGGDADLEVLTPYGAVGWRGKIALAKADPDCKPKPVVDTSEPVIASVLPPSVPRSGAQEITMVGTALKSITEVRLAGQNAKIEKLADTRLTISLTAVQMCAIAPGDKLPLQLLKGDKLGPATTIGVTDPSICK